MHANTSCAAVALLCFIEVTTEVSQATLEVRVTFRGRFIGLVVKFDLNLERLEIEDSIVIECFPNDFEDFKPCRKLVRDDFVALLFHRTSR